MRHFCAKRKSFITALIVACFITCLFVMSKNSFAEGDTVTPFYSETLYNMNNGLGSNRVNAVYQTKSGYIWIGTDAGLFRYNGNEFQVYNLWDTLRDDVYIINALYQDEAGRLWVCTKNYGLFYIKGSDTVHFSTDYYNGVKNIYDVCTGPDGLTYVATAYGLYSVNEEDVSLNRVEKLAGKRIDDLTEYDGRMWGISRGDSLFSISEDGQIEEKAAKSFTESELTCLAADDEYLYIGTSGRDVIRTKGFSNVQIFTSGRESINELFINGDKLFVCGDTGIGYFDKRGEYSFVRDNLIDSYFSDAIVDYEGNMWFASSRLGLLKMSISKFADFNRKTGLAGEITNSVYSYNGTYYISTDKGLQMLNGSGKMLESDLSADLEGSKINYVTIDSKGNTWVCSPRLSGLIKYEKNGEIKNFGMSDGLPSYRTNYCLELSSGDMAVATEEGIAIISPKDKIEKTYTEADGLASPSINILYEASDGTLYAGSEGDGLYGIKDGKITNYDTDQGLNSDNVISICESRSGGTIYIGTDNGLFVMDGSIRQITSIDFSNNIYSIIMYKDEVWLVGSKGILRTTEEELLSAGGISGRYWAAGDGLDKTITINSHSHIDSKGILYICCNEGIMTLDTNNIVINETAPRFAVSSIDVDGETYFYDEIGGSLTIPKDASRVSISFSLLSYANHENGSIEYRLTGVDSEPVSIKGDQLMQVVYTNLEGGRYTFTLNAENGDGTRGESDVSFSVYKKFGILDNIWFRIMILLLSAALIFGIVVVVIKYRKQLEGKEVELLRLTKEHEDAIRTSSARTDFVANMSNDIKIPINSIIRLAENIRSTNTASDEEARSLDSIIESGNKIIEKVDESITLAQLESGRAVAAEEPYSVTTLMCDVSDYVVNNLKEKELRFVVDLGNDIPDILIGDYEKIRNVLTILLDNAIKHTKEGSITLSVDSFPYSDENEKDMETINFTISDTGVGLTDEAMENLFEIQKSDGGRMNVSLTVAKKITELLGGELVCDSTYGAGSTFTLSLIEKKGDKKIYSVVESDDVYMMSEAEAEKLMAKDVNALVVDDVDVNRAVDITILNKFEIKTDVATSGVSSIDMVMNNKYDIVFMDAVMPVMSGTDALKEIRELTGSRYKKLPVIAMSEDATGEDKEGLLAAGFNDVILKPMDIRHVATMLKKHLPSYKLKEKPAAPSNYITETRYWDGLSQLGSEIDTALGLEKIGGSIEVYNKVLTAFYNQNEAQPKELQTLFSENLRGFRNRIHNIRNGAVNIGAANLSNEATKLESAINIGNRTYVKNNLHSFTVYLKKVLDMVGQYLDFVDRVKGLSDEEYDKLLLAEENMEEGNVTAETGDGLAQTEPLTTSQNPDRIARKYLDSLSEASRRKDDSRLRRKLKSMRKEEYGADDMDFIDALENAVEQKDYDTVNELINTYLSLKY